MQALPGDELLRLIAEMIPGGSVASPLGSLAVMTVEEVDETCRKTLVPAIKSVLLRKREQLILQELRDSQKPQEQNGNKNGKFFVAKFGKLADFHGGIAAQVMMMILLLFFPCPWNCVFGLRRVRTRRSSTVF